MKKIVFLAAVAAMVLCSCSQEGWSKEEVDIIMNQGEVMRVLTVRNQEDSTVLRKISTDIPAKALRGEEFRILSRKMIATVTSPEQDGVGIAGPQVGISRRVVAVQRFDKEGEPFEVYPNIRILERRGEPQLGPEGCLSVPDCRGDVLRYREIDIRYTALPSGKDTTETVKGFTAVIFQHECDHLDGILYTDYLN